MIGDLDEEQLRATYRELKRERLRLLKEAATLEDRMREIEELIQVAVAERIWREHPRWQRDRPTANRRVEDMVGSALRELRAGAQVWGLGGHRGIVDMTAQSLDIVEGSIIDVGEVDE